MKTKLLLSALFVSALMQAQTYTNGTSITIPDGVGCGPTAVVSEGTSTINVPLSGTITNPTNVTINLNLTHTWLGDVVVRLETPGGTSCALIKRMGSASDASAGDSSDFSAANQLSFNSANTTLIDVVTPGAAVAIPAGSYAPTGGSSATLTPTTLSLCNLSTFLNGIAINGDWKLNASDYCADDIGTIATWSLVFTGLGGEEFVFSNAVSVLGNPFENELVVKVNNLSTTSAVVNLYSMDGKLVNQTIVTNFAETTSIDTSTLTQGVYLLVAEVDGVTQKAIRVIKK